MRWFFIGLAVLFIQVYLRAKSSKLVVLGKENVAGSRGCAWPELYLKMSEKAQSGAGDGDRTHGPLLAKRDSYLRERNFLDFGPS